MIDVNFPLFASSSLPTTGIVATSIAVIGAIVLFLLVRVLTFLKTGGTLTYEVSRLKDISTMDIRLQAKLFNSTGKDYVYSDFGLYQKKNGKYELVQSLELNPIETGGSHGKWDYLGKTLQLERGASYFAIFQFSSDTPYEKGQYALGFARKKGKIEYVPFSF